ncbi:hypothetical protein [Chengkuizengella sediminis]|uniref:hypothetical protein n=1 Tax=Chengkuizengella sediminis TaxID=1885917 RepID=UPI001F0D50B5|nr:hypothetical protein [Chengkuizengella sediminis]
MSKIIFSENKLIYFKKIQMCSGLVIWLLLIQMLSKINLWMNILAGKFPRQIFEEHGFDIDIIGLKRIEQSAHRWKKAYEKDGMIGLTDTRKTSSGKPLKTRTFSSGNYRETGSKN